MTKFDIERVIDSKRELRKELAARPIAEKLRMLDELRRRARTLKAARRVDRGERASDHEK